MFSEEKFNFAPRLTGLRLARNGTIELKIVPEYIKCRSSAGCVLW